MSAAWVTLAQVLNPDTMVYEPVEVCSACGIARDVILDWNQHGFWHSQDGRP